MKKTDPYKLLRIISLILGIICMLLMLKGKVFAAEMSDQDQNYIETLISGIDNYVNIETELNFVYQNFPFFVHYHTEYFDIVLFTSNSNISSRHCMIDDSGTTPEITQFWIWGFRGGTDRMYITSYDTSFTMAQAVTNPHSNIARNEKIFEVQLVIQNYHDLTVPIKTASIGCFGLYDDDLAIQTWSYQPKDFYTGELGLWTYTYNYNYFSSSDCKQNWVTSSTGNTYQNPFQLRGHDANNEYHFNGSYNYLQPDSNDSFTVFTNHDTYIASGNNLNNSDIYNNIVANIDYPPTSNTSGFNVYTFGSTGSEELILDFTNCIAIDPATSQYSTATIVIDINGTDNTFNLDSESIYYNFSDTTNRHAWYQIPFRYFGITDSDFARLKSVYIENITSAHGGSYETDIYWFTELQLTGSDISPLEPGEINNVSDYPAISAEDIANNTYMVEFNSLAGLDNFDFRAASLPDAYDQDMGRVYIYSGNIPFSDFLSWADPTGTIEDIIGYFNNVSTIDAAETIVNSYLEDNAFTCTFSGILFVWVDQNNTSQVVNPENCYYWFYPTVSGRIKAANYLLNDMNTDISRQLDVASGLANYLKDKLDDFEEKTLNGFNAQIGLINNTNSILNKLQNALKRIIELLQNLDIEIPEADYSSIISAINGVKTAIENQNSGNIDTDSYTGYKAWLFDIDREDAIVSPHEFAIDSLNTVKGFFAWATTRYYPSAAAEFFQRARDYVTFLNGTNDQYHNYSTGIVNGNYDPHNINGTQYP